MELVSRFIALSALLILGPLFITLMVLCMTFQGFPIFFRQERVGNNFIVFKIYKFRTMIHNSGNLITKTNDNRITFLGKFLRKSKLDEIPQLLNIMKGEMRFVGPRPEVLKYFKEKDFQFLKNIKPGISDYASIILRNEDKILSKIGGQNPYLKLLPVKLSLANYYSKNKSFFLDLKIVVITVIAIFFPKISNNNFFIAPIKADLPELESFINDYLI